MASFAIELIFGRGSTPVVIRAFKLYVAIRVLRFVYRWIKGFVDPKRLICETAMPYVKMLPMVQHQLKKTQIELRASLSKEMSKESESDAMRSTTRLPKEGVCTNALLELMKMRAEIDTKHWVKGKITGAVYHGGEEHMEFCGKVMGMFAYTNPLHPGLHPATRKMDAEVVRMVLNMYVSFLSSHLFCTFSPVQQTNLSNTNTNTHTHTHTHTGTTVTRKHHVESSQREVQRAFFVQSSHIEIEDVQSMEFTIQTS